MCTVRGAGRALRPAAANGATAVQAVKSGGCFARALRRGGLASAVAGAVWGASLAAAAAALLPGEYACAGSGGTILVGLGFKVLADGSYTDLDGKTSGRLAYGADGSTVSFVGGHLAGEVGRNIRGGRSFEVHSISCSRV